MYYITDLMERIIKSETAQSALDWIPPVYGSAYTFLWLLEVIGQEVDDMDSWIESYQNQLTPTTATWSLPYWEERYGIITNPDLSIDLRREAVVSKRNSRMPMNPARMEQLISAETGYPTVVTDGVAANAFGVLCQGYIDETRVRQIINKNKPSHLIYELKSAFLEKAEHTTYMGIQRSTYEKYRVEVM